MIVTQTRIKRRWKIHAAHWLPKVPEGHKCRGLHGHTYDVEVVVQGEVGPDGWVCDFAELDRIWQPIAGVLDHHVLNEVPGLANPTVELVAAWILERFVASCRHIVVEVAMSEGGDGSVVVRNASMTQQFNDARDLSAP